MNKLYDFGKFCLLLIVLTVQLGASNPKDSSKEQHYIDVGSSKGMQDFFRYSDDRMLLLSAHRGGAGINLPENCIETFEFTLSHTYSILEIDPRYTRDSVIILHHDPTLDRTTTGTGRVADFTYKELKGLRLKDIEGNESSYKIPTLKEALEWAKGKTILVLDKKNVPVEKRVKMVEECGAEACAIVMVYSFDEAKKVYQMNNQIIMQVFINSPEKVQEFDQTGVPWENIVAFVSHQKPENNAVFKQIHNKGALCILGTSRTLDKKLAANKTPTGYAEIRQEYQALFQSGADIIETDLPVQVDDLMNFPIAGTKSKYLK